MGSDASSFVLPLGEPHDALTCNSLKSEENDIQPRALLSFPKLDLAGAAWFYLMAILMFLSVIAWCCSIILVQVSTSKLVY